MSFVKWFRKNQKWFDLGSKILEELQKSREGGFVSKTMAGIAITKEILNRAFPTDSADAYLQHLGYVECEDVPRNVRGFLCDIIDRTGPPTKVKEVDYSTYVHFWETTAGSICYVTHDNEFNDGPFVLNGDMNFVRDFVLGAVWGPNKDLMLDCEGAYQYYYQARNKYDFTNIPQPGSYIGEKGPDYWADRLRKYGSEPRTLLIKGPTGVGKSVLARQIANRLADDNSRTLKLSNKALVYSDTNVLVSVTQLLRPTVLLLDDVSFDMMFIFLEVLERLRIEDCVVILTQMTDTDKDTGKRGEGYIEGLRPERIDEVIVLHYPNANEREQILRNYYTAFELPYPTPEEHKALVEATDNLTGAYLKELVRRIKVHGLANWREELDNILYMAPSVEDKEDDDTDEEDKKERKQKRKSAKRTLDKKSLKTKLKRDLRTPEAKYAKYAADESTKH